MTRNMVDMDKIMSGIGFSPIRNGNLNVVLKLTCSDSEHGQLSFGHAGDSFVPSLNMEP